MEIRFKKLIHSNRELAVAFEKWENDPALIPFTRPNRTPDDLKKRVSVTVESLANRLKDHEIYLMYADEKLIGEVEFQADPAHLLKKETGTAWVGIVIAEESARGKGVGTLAMHFIEDKIKEQGFRRIELGVFEFNAQAIKLYKKLGFREIARLDDYTFWQRKFWQDIRLEKYLK